MANLTNTQSRVIPHTQDISTINWLETRLADIEAAEWTAADDIEALEWRMDTAESDIANRYTKAETDSAISSAVSSVYKYKGSVANYAALPVSGQIVGDVYNVEAADSTHEIKAGDNVAWNGTAWDVLAGTVDLSNYYTKSEVDDLIDGAAGDITALEGRMDTAEADIDALEGRMDTAEDDIDAVEGRLDTAEANISGLQTDVSNRYTKTEINTMSGLAGATAGFVSNTVSENASTGDLTVTAADNVSIATAESNNKSAIAAIATAHNNLIDRVEALEEGDDEKTKFFQINFSWTSHSYSNAFIQADSFVNYNFSKDPAGYVSFSVEAGKINITSSAAETNLVIKVSVTNNPGTFVELSAD